MSQKFGFSTVVLTVGFFSVLCGWSHETLAQFTTQELNSKVAETLDSLEVEIQRADERVSTAAWTTLERPHWQSNEAASVADQPRCCPNCCKATEGCDGCEGICPATQKFSNAPCPYATRAVPPTPNGFIQNQYAESPSQKICEDLAETMTECLSDSQIPVDARRRILASTMKLLVRNAELESQAEVAQLQLQHERELAATRENLIQLQARMSASGEVKNWMGPLYTNLNQTQQSINNVMTNLQLVNRTLRLLENEKNATKRRQANQPLPAQMVPQPQVNPRPERWSQLPKHAEPPKKTESRDHTTQQSHDNRNDTFLSSTSQPAPPRLSDRDVQRQQLESRMRQLQAELDRFNSQNIRTVGWESETVQQHPNQLRSNQLRPMQQPQLRPMQQPQPHPLQPLRDNR